MIEGCLMRAQTRQRTEELAMDGAKATGSRTKMAAAAGVAKGS